MWWTSSDICGWWQKDIQRARFPDNYLYGTRKVYIPMWKKGVTADVLLFYSSLDYIMGDVQQRQYNFSLTFSLSKHARQNTLTRTNPHTHTPYTVTHRDEDGVSQITIYTAAQSYKISSVAKHFLRCGWYESSCKTHMKCTTIYWENAVTNEDIPKTHTHIHMNSNTQIQFSASGGHVSKPSDIYSDPDSSSRNATTDWWK